MIFIECVEIRDMLKSWYSQTRYEYSWILVNKFDIFSVYWMIMPGHKNITFFHKIFNVYYDDDVSIICRFEIPTKLLHFRNLYEIRLSTYLQFKSIHLMLFQHVFFVDECVKIYSDSSSGIWIRMLEKWCKTNRIKKKKSWRIVNIHTWIQQWRWD